MGMGVSHKANGFLVGSGGLDKAGDVPWTAGWDSSQKHVGLPRNAGCMLGEEGFCWRSETGCEPQASPPATVTLPPEAIGRHRLCSPSALGCAFSSRGLCLSGCLEDRDPGLPLSPSQNPVYV